MTDRPLFSLMNFMLAALVSGAIVYLMIRIGVMDDPVARSSHSRSTPKGGGVGVIGVFLFGLPVLRIAYGMVPLSISTLTILTATILLSVISWLDDVRQWPASVKFATQMLASLIILAGQGWILDLAGLPGAGLALLWLIFVANAINFIDGLNGLAAGCMLITALVAGISGLALGHNGMGIQGLLLSAGLAGFLPFNFPRARIFMGDVGSQSAGLMIGTMGVELAHAASTHTTIAPPFHAWCFVPLLLSGILYDVAFTLVRRAFAGNALTQAHRAHLYQLAQRSFMPATAVTLVEWAFTLWGGIVAWELAASPGFPAVMKAFLAVIIPQLGWTTLVCAQARRHISVRW